MTHRLEFFFDYGSPTTYLAYTQLPGLVARTGAELILKPMLLGGVFKATGNTTPAAIPPKGAYMGTDLARFAKRYGVPLNFNPYFPVNTLFLMRGTYVADEEGALQKYMDMAFHNMWVARKNLNDPDVTTRMFQENGFDAEHYLKRTQEPGIKEKLKAVTEEAIARGAFGAPTFFVDETEMFFGQDRLDFVEEALRA